MTYYADLTPYAYDEHDQPMINAGWLDRDHPFPTGDVDPETFARLVHLATFDRAVMRGWHDCQFCDEESPIRLPVEPPGREVLLGHGEIRLESDAGRVYAAPTLICHYVSAHSYLPPSEFLDALRTGSVGPPEIGRDLVPRLQLFAADTAVTFRHFS